MLLQHIIDQEESEYKAINYKNKYSENKKNENLPASLYVVCNKTLDNINTV